MNIVGKAEDYSALIEGIRTPFTPSRPNFQMGLTMPNKLRYNICLLVDWQGNESRYTEVVHAHRILKISVKHYEIWGLNRQARQSRTRL